MSEIIHSPNAHHAMWESLNDKEYRHALVAAHVGDFLAIQIHSMRLQRGWTQSRLAKESGNTQPQISNFETSCEGVNLSSLHKLAEAFDVSLIVKFAPFSQSVREMLYAQADASVPSFDDDSEIAISYRTNVSKSNAEPRSPERLSWTGTSGYASTIDGGRSNANISLAS